MALKVQLNILNKPYSTQGKIYYRQYTESQRSYFNDYFGSGVHYRWHDRNALDFSRMQSALQ